MKFLLTGHFRMKPCACLALAACLALLMWLYYLRYHQIAENLLATRGFPQHNFSDLYPRWLGSRELLLNRKDPYSAEITRKIQEGYYGRPIGRDRFDPVDEQRFAYPLFIVFLFAPTVLLPFHAVKLLFTILLTGAAFCTIFFWMKLVGIKFGMIETVASIFVCLATIPYAEGIQLQQLSVLVAFVAAMAVLALAKGKFALSGVLLGFSTIKPQLSIAFLGCVLLWAFCKWKQRYAVVVSFLITMTLLIGASEVILPQWHKEFIAGIGPYLQYTQATSGVRELFGSAGAYVFCLASAMIVILAVLLARATPADSSQFTTAVIFALAFTSLAVPSLAPHNEVLIIPAFLLLARRKAVIWQMGVMARSLWKAAFLVIGWPLVTGSFLISALLITRDSRVLQYWELPLKTNPIIPLVVFCALCPLLVPRRDVVESTDTLMFRNDKREPV